MKKILAAILLMGLLGTGLWWLVRRSPSSVPKEDTQAIFGMERVGQGLLVRYQDTQTPLRSLRWLPPLPGGILVVQVVSQSDRQQITLFKGSSFLERYVVPKPAGVRDGFFNFAELRDAVVVEGDVAVLLYISPGSDGEDLPLVAALDLKSRDLRWVHRAQGEHLVMTTTGKDEAVYLYGSKNPIVRLPLSLGNGEQPGRSGIRSAAKTIDLPDEILEVGNVLPTGAWTFLVAHKSGLSSYLGIKGWLHYPAPEGGVQARPMLAGGKTFWWQARPGILIQVRADGTTKTTWTQEDLTTADPFLRDASLLHLLGMDPEGHLWFDLATPSPSKPQDAEPEVHGPSTPEASSESQWKPETAVGSEATPVKDNSDDWTAYISQGLGRLYRWDPEKRILQRYDWSTLNVPPGFARPASVSGVCPASGSLFLENGNSAWWVPLSSLTLGSPTSTGKSQVR